MKSPLLFLLLVSISFGLDTVIDSSLNFSITFPASPKKTVTENRDSYGKWNNINYTAVEKSTNRTTVLIVKDYTEYEQGDISGAAIVTTTATSLLQNIKMKNPFELSLTKGEHRIGYSFSNDKGQIHFHVYWAKSILYILMIEEPHTVGVSFLDMFPHSFNILK